MYLPAGYKKLYYPVIILCLGVTNQEPIQQISTITLLKEAATEVHKWEISLGKGRKGNAEKAFAALTNGSLELGAPEHHIYKQNFTDLGPIKPSHTKGVKEVCEARIMILVS